MLSFSTVYVVPKIRHMFKNAVGTLSQITLSNMWLLIASLQQSESKFTLEVEKKGSFIWKKNSSKKATGGMMRR